MQMKSKYNGICKKCNKKINIGDNINWEKGMGATHVNCESPKPKNVQTGTFPLYVVYEHCDPRIDGDNFSEVYDMVHMIDTYENCLAYYKQTKRDQRSMGCGIPVISYTYPDQIKEGQTLTIGQKHIIHRAKNVSHLSPDEIWELEHC